MKVANIRNIFLGLSALAVIGAPAIAGAQSLRHTIMDSHAARADLARLERERTHAVRHHNWSRVHQLDRLIEADRHFIHKDMRKIHRIRGH
ncbi:MAG TPA: hypothetical protein VG944_07210 [Fimbriimonas sp.]|nr:hypothetical protein [Fimbriimonas sp.]